MSEDLHNDFFNACMDGKIDIVRSLISRVDVHCEKDYALRMAVWRGHFSIVKILCEAGADIHVYDDEALRMASQYGYFDIVKYLIEAGADIHATDFFMDITAIQYAVERNHLQVANLLYSAGADIFVVPEEYDNAFSRKKKEEVEQIKTILKTDPNSIGLMVDEKGIGVIVAEYFA